MAGIFAISLDRNCWDELKRGTRHLQPIRGDKHGGFAILAGNEIYPGKCDGLVEPLFQARSVEDPIIKTGRMAIGGTSFQDSQPVFAESVIGPFAIVGDMRIVNRPELATRYPYLVGSDLRICAGLIAGSKNPVMGLERVFENVKGRFNLAILTLGGLFVCRDSRGFRSLTIGREKGGGCAVASESSVLGAAFGETEVELIREVKPGEIIRIESTGFRSLKQIPSKGLVICSFDIAYGQGPASIFEGISVYGSRFNLGKKLYQRYPVEAKISFPFPLSGNSVCEGWAFESGIPMVNLWQYNALIGRSYLPPSEDERKERGRGKLSPIEWIIREFGQIVGVDDSIVEGNQLLARLLLLYRLMRRYHRENGEIHLRISCPPKIKGCPLEVPSHPTEKLFAVSRNKETMQGELRVDSLEFNTLDDFLEVILNAQSEEKKRENPLTPGNLCQCCFTGEDIMEKYFI